MPLSTSRLRDSPDNTRGFFHLCGSPIRMHPRKPMDFDAIYEPKPKQNPTQCSPTFVRPAEVVALPLLPPPLINNKKKKKKKERQQQHKEEATRANQLDVEGHAYYYHDKRLHEAAPSSSMLLDTPVTTQAVYKDSRRLDSARRAGVPLCLSDWFDPIVKLEDVHQGEPESECTTVYTLKSQSVYKDQDTTDAVQNATASDQFLAPQQNVHMADVTIGRVIGEGAFGKVFQASWLGRDVAVKVLVRQNLTADVVREFETEVKIMSGLHHANICLLLGACLAPESRALVIELVEHGSLWAVLRTRRRQLSDAMRARFVVDTARGMRYLHQFALPILHRDMKSPNLLVARDFSIKISDFGLSRVKAQIQTMTGNCGTVQWMAPEVLGNCKYTEKADVFSFGIVVWEIFTGQCPYDGMTQIQVALGVLNHDLRPVIPRSCPRFFARLIQSCWAREPSLRPSFAELMRTFEQHVASH